MIAWCALQKRKNLRHDGSLQLFLWGQQSCVSPHSLTYLITRPQTLPVLAAQALLRGSGQSR